MTRSGSISPGPSPRGTSAGILSLVLASVAVLVACKEERPTYDLKMLMYQVERDQLAAEAILGDPARLPDVLVHLRSIETYSAREYFEAHTERPSFVGDPATFLQRQEFFAGRLAETLAAAESGDAGGTAAAWMRMRMACEVCHTEFRPEVR